MMVSNHPSYKHLKACRQRCNDKNASNYKFYGGKNIECELSNEDIEFLYERDKASEMNQPSLSRKNHNKNYTIDNCIFCEKYINVSERNTRILSKPILQFDKKGNFIREWKSTIEAIKELKIGRNGIYHTLLGKQKSAYNFIWKLK